MPAVRTKDAPIFCSSSPTPADDVVAFDAPVLYRHKAPFVHPPLTSQVDISGAYAPPPVVTAQTLVPLFTPVMTSPPRGPYCLTPKLAIATEAPSRASSVDATKQAATGSSLAPNVEIASLHNARFPSSHEASPSIDGLSSEFEFSDAGSDAGLLGAEASLPSPGAHSGGSAAPSPVHLSGSAQDENGDDVGEDEVDDQPSTARVLIKHPGGEPGRPNSGGYRMKEELGWADADYNRLKRVINTLVETMLDVTQPYAKQAILLLDAVRDEAIKQFPVLDDYEFHWPINDMVKMRLKYILARQKHAKPKRPANISPEPLGRRGSRV